MSFSICAVVSLVRRDRSAVRELDHDKECARSSSGRKPVGVRSESQYAARPAKPTTSKTASTATLERSLHRHTVTIAHEVDAAKDAPIMPRFAPGRRNTALTPGDKVSAFSAEISIATRDRHRELAKKLPP